MQNENCAYAQKIGSGDRDFLVLIEKSAAFGHENVFKHV